ncbi:MAG: 16S rRNA (adenine(1518)-N(6)/adenine(1519)-N(6))-dimethyltransferase RsmA [Phenylobacterium sp.]|uniref:16S rRNA (adenine(1518)-N(6)/adenine(1519)-N(6))- dimethyltransferase RsmA n=1 Tax=Phenylobacterium sp. TaxID=1871053 RepID=UPI0025F2843F|nr:16S rRNA (adenine(1518)-N(6)/adenine(1519)-N(6))-dimethyltransferase RsmA [Phenylobacterium sp.]MCG9916525.1 16S rRNA (adenine(1518)-N(6)/adenine(1519)-N(6))-dimethyltransferase RsmA [Phenylobacterium sp.]
MSALSDLPPLRESLEAHGLMADKGLGQHFLLDLNITRKIARLAGPLEGRQVLEIGPGPGGLTRALLEAGAHVTVIEKDQRFLPLLKDLSAISEDRLKIEMADALKVNETDLTGGAPVTIVSNLPYNIGTALLIKWLTGSYRPASMTLMFQKEVAQRIVARPGDDAYGRLALIAQATAQAKIVMEAPARAFTPPPKVDSAVVRLDPLPDRPPEPLISALERVSQAAFGQRRKMLRSSLKVVGGADLCESAGIDPSRRAETLALEEFMALASALLKAETTA